MHPLLLELKLGSLTIPIHTYGLMIALGFLSGVYTVRKLAARSGVKPDLVSDLAFWLLLIGFVGARLLYIITRLDFFLANPAEIVRVWEGGLVFFGGLITATAYGIWYIRKHRLPVWKMADILLPGVVIAHAFGRVGCLAAGCCYGKPTGVPWGIRLDSDLVDFQLRGIPLHPTQLYESTALFILFAGMIWLFRHRKFDGQVGLTYFLLYPVIRSIIEVYRGDSVRGFVIDGILSTSQFISLLVFLAAGYVLMHRLKQAEEEFHARRR
jgi:phosphatidylglycerol:prolipoprotein diacylglycerol transferase